MMIFPVVQVIIFYFAVNINSILLAFKQYSYGLGEEIAGYSFAGFANFGDCLYDLFNDFSLISSWKNSLLAFFMQSIIMPWIAMFFSYYIYQNRTGAKLFNVFLFLPSIISPLVITMIYKTVLNDALPALIFKVFGTKTLPIYSSNTMPSILIYYMLTSFGTSVLLYSGAMSSIEPSIMEAADLDGAVGIKGFIYVTFPLVYPTFITFITVGIAAFFVNQLNLYSFERGGAEKQYYTFGYFLYLKTATGRVSDYPYLSAMGIIFTIITIPVTFGVRKLLYKFGPSVD